MPERIYLRRNTSENPRSNETPEQRSERIGNLTVAIRAGSYRVDIKSLTEAILDSAIPDGDTNLMKPETWERKKASHRVYMKARRKSEKEALNCPSE